MTTALLLMAHGSRQPEANDDLHQAVAELRRRGEYAIIEASFLELAQPTIKQAAAACVAGGATRVILVPYFLSAGTHVRQDLAAIARELTAQFPHVDFRLAEPLGPHPLLLDVVLERARTADS